MKIISLLFVLAAASLTVVTRPVQAETVATSRVVSTAGLDLRTGAGVRTLDLRIFHAASALCGTPSPALPKSVATFTKCRAEAQANAAHARELAIQKAQSSRRVASNR